MSMNDFLNKKEIRKDRGFVMLFSVLVAALILLIGTGIFSVIQKEVVLSSYARESQRAFYAADSALECALYADIVGVGSPNPTTPFTVSPPDPSHEVDFSCGGVETTSTYLSSGNGTSMYQYPYVFRYRNNKNTAQDLSCAYVLVEKNLKENGEPTDLSVVEVRITAIGFNVCNTLSGSGGQTPGDGSLSPTVPDFDDPTLLERRISITYNR